MKSKMMKLVLSLLTFISLAGAVFGQDNKTEQYLARVTARQAIPNIELNRALKVGVLTKVKGEYVLKPYVHKIDKGKDGSMIISPLSENGEPKMTDVFPLILDTKESFKLNNFNEKKVLLRINYATEERPYDIIESVKEHIGIAPRK